MTPECCRKDEIGSLELLLKLVRALKGLVLDTCCQVDICRGWCAL